MTGDYDAGTPTLQVSVYEDGELVAQVPCESTEEAAGIVREWEEREGVECEVEDLAVRHGPDDVLAPEPEDSM
jgi:hypothetical protein